jgi:hypothetical protein
MQHLIFRQPLWQAILSKLASTNPESAISFYSSVRYNVHLVTAQFIFPADIYKTSAGCGEARAKLPLC